MTNRASLTGATVHGSDYGKSILEAIKNRIQPAVPAGKRMPLGSPPLSKEEIEALTAEL